jgi:hypothetical protein
MECISVLEDVAQNGRVPEHHIGVERSHERTPPARAVLGLIRTDGAERVPRAVANAKLRIEGRNRADVVDAKVHFHAVPAAAQAWIADFVAAEIDRSECALERGKKCVCEPPRADLRSVADGVRRSFPTQIEATAGGGPGHRDAFRYER